MEHLLGRRGAARIALIPQEVLEALNDGRIPTVNLNEFLAIDPRRLACSVAARIGLDPQAERLQDTLAMLAAFPPVKRHGHVARALYDLAEPRPDRDAVAHGKIGVRFQFRGALLLATASGAPRRCEIGI